jgi:Collagen triple helix repeat (20 copies)
LPKHLYQGELVKQLKRLLPMVVIACLAIGLTAGTASAAAKGPGAASVSKGKKGKRGARGPHGPQGPQGPQGKEGKDGSQGPQGPKGATGDRGPSNGYQAFNNFPGTIPTTTGELGSLSVPAGNYLASAKLWVENEGAARVKVTCTLTNDVTGDSDTSEVTADPIGSTSWFGRSMISLQAATVLSSAGKWIVSCSSNGAASVIAANLKIQAIQVGSLTNSPA